jgi:hypothetical protein
MEKFIFLVSIHPKTKRRRLRRKILISPAEEEENSDSLKSLKNTSEDIEEIII